jgi:predicted nucleotidyltransferase
MLPIPLDVPNEIETPLKALVVALNQLLDANLVGIYLHGSLAMGCFNRASSDVDLLVVVTEKLSSAAKHQVAAALLVASVGFLNNSIELSVVTLAATQQCEYPAPYELHFSDLWKARYLANLVDFDEEKFDPDLAAHFTITSKRGWCLYGRPIKDVFGDVPEEYYRASILNDAQVILVDIGKHPVYGILNLCRVLAYLSDRQITSKAEGGEWALSHIETQYTGLVKEALGAYRDSSPRQRSWDLTELAHFAGYMRQRISPQNTLPSISWARVC